jgi:cytosine deaminase
MDRFLAAALKEAKKNLKKDGIPIGAALVVGGKLVAIGRNRRREGSPTGHAEMDCLERFGRHPPAVYRRATLYTTLSPCPMCSGAILLFKIPHVVIGENRNFKGPEAYLRRNGVELSIVNDRTCIQVLAEFIDKHPDLWYEDISVKSREYRGARAQARAVRVRSQSIR